MNKRFIARYLDNKYHIFLLKYSWFLVTYNEVFLLKKSYKALCNKNYRAFDTNILYIKNNISSIIGCVFLLK